MRTFRTVMIRFWLTASLLTAGCAPSAPPQVAHVPAASAPSGTTSPSAGEHVSVAVGVRKVVVGPCNHDVRFPEVTGPAALMKSTSTWVNAWFDGFTSELKDGAAAGTCAVDPKPEVVHSEQTRGLLQLAWLTPATDPKFQIAQRALFVVETGEKLDAIVRENAEDELRRHLLPRYRAAYRTVRKECDTSGWGPDFRDFTLSPTGVTFSDWTSIPMANKACGGDVDQKVSLLVTFDDLAPWLRADVALRIAVSK